MVVISIKKVQPIKHLKRMTKSTINVTKKVVQKQLNSGFIEWNSQDTIEEERCDRN
jgi:hypothetical protein